MFTLCPHCESTHRVNADQLSAAQGEVLCAHCGKTFNALGQLQDHFPSGPKKPAATSAKPPPELGKKSVAMANSLAEALAEEVPEKSSGSLWTALLLALAVVTLLNLFWTFRDEIASDSAVAKSLANWGIPGFEEPPLFRDPSRIHLVTRDIHAHPTRSGVLVLSATFVNLADSAQPYPSLAVTLMDSDNQPIAARLFEADSYLVHPAPVDAMLAPNEHVPVLLEFADPGEKATGFEIQFY